VKAYVDAEVAGIVDSAPGTLDTLNELAAALGDDANFSTTVTNSIALKAPLASPTFTGTLTASGLAYPTSDGTNGQVLTTDGAGTLSFSTISGYTDSDVETYLNTSEIYTDPTNNRLGIGTSSPSNSLHVASADSTVAHFQHTDGINSNIRISDTSDSFYLVSRDGLGSIGGVNSSSNSNLNIDLTSGNVGIGTTTVNAPLHLGSASPHIDLGLATGNRGKVGFDSNNVYIGSSSGTGEIHFKNNIGSTDAPHSSGDTKMVITDSGVGIGTTSPNSKTHIVGAANAIALRVTNAAVDGNNADLMHIEPSNGAYYGKLLRIQSGRSDFSDSLLFLNTTTGMNGTNGSYMRVQNNLGADIFRIKGDGSVGIGTSSPDVKLHLEDASRVDIKFERTGSETHYIRKDGNFLRFRGHDDSTVLFELKNNTDGSNAASFPNGNLGIGTTNPKQKLHVNGTMLAGQGATAGSVALYNEYNSGTGDYLANWGTQYSSAAAAMSYGVRSTSSGWLSTYDNFSGQRGTLLVDGELEYLSATSTSVGTAVGSVVTLTSRLKVDSNGRVIIGDQLNFSNRTDSSFIKGDDGTGEIGYYADQNHKFYVYEGSWKNTVEVLSTGQVRFQGDQTEGNGGYLSSWDDNSGVFSGGGYQTQSGFYWTSNRTSNMSCDSGQIMFYANYTGGTAGQVNSVTMRAKINDSSNSGDFYTNDGSVSSLSDSRLKTNIENLTDGLDILTQLRPVTFEYNDNSVDERGREQLGKADGITRYGFIAQEVESVAPQYVNTETGMIGGEEVDDLKSMSQTRLIPMLVKSIQEQQTIIESLEARITALES
jgi:hypothetical protein